MARRKIDWRHPPRSTMDRSNEWLECDRTVAGHAWDQISHPNYIALPMYGWPMTHRCVRCGTVRVKTIDRNGNIGGSRYIYPEGYQYARNTKPDNRQIRLEAIARRAAEIQREYELENERMIEEAERRAAEG